MHEKELRSLVSKMVEYASENPDLTRYLWCKNCETVLGILTGWNFDWDASDVWWDKNDTGCPHCGDTGARLSDGEKLLKRWAGLTSRFEEIKPFVDTD